MSSSLALVCVVEHEGALRTLLCTQLERGGFATVEAANGPAGLRVVQRTSAAVVVVDVAPPGDEDLAMIRALKERSPDTRILAISGGGIGDYLKRARQLGADAVMAKPFGAKDLTECVKRLAWAEPTRRVQLRTPTV